MFKIIDCEQGTEEWFASRLGKITASNFSKIVTTKGKASASSKTLINRAVAELLTGEKEDGFKSEAMQRGNDLEEKALDYVNFTHGYDFKPVGFLDGGGWGCSPDSLDLERKMGLELKCPLASTQVKYLYDGKLPTEYFQQVQGSMMVTGYSKWVFCSYHPLLDSLVLEVERDEEFITALRVELIKCSKEINEKYKKLKGL